MKCSGVNPSDDTPSITSTQLLRAAQASDQDAWQELVQTYSRRMYRWCRRAGLQPADAANVVQEAFASVARKLKDFRRDRPSATFRGWLRRIVDNKIRDHFRRLGRQADVAVGGTDAHCRLAETLQAVDGVADGDSGPAGTASVPRPSVRQEAVAEIVARTRAEVGPRDWKLFWRVAVDGQSAVEVGCEFGVTANAVRIVKMRVLRRLRGYLDELE